MTPERARGKQKGQAQDRHDAVAEATNDEQEKVLRFDAGPRVTAGEFEQRQNCERKGAKHGAQHEGTPHGGAQVVVE